MLYFLYISTDFLYYLFEVLRNSKSRQYKSVVRGPINLSEFFSDFWTVYKEENGLGWLMNFREIEKNHQDLKEIEN